MARMIPRTPFDSPSNAELELFERIREELPRPWVALHSVGVAEHVRKPWAEIDFVLLGPGGVVSLEVKGGGVNRRAGEWVFSNASGVVGTKREGPWEQAKTGSFALRSYLVQHDRRFEHVLHSWGVVMPETTFKHTGPDTPAGVLVDQRNADQAVKVWVDRIVDYWRERLEARHYVEGLEGDLLVRAVDLIRGDFDLPVDPRRRVADIVGRLHALTTDQMEVVRHLSINPRMIISGGAGTGKTVIAMDEARRLAGTGQRVLLTCYNRRLARRMAASLDDVDLVDVTTFHSLCGRLASSVGRQVPVAGSEQERYEALVDAALEGALQRLGEYDAVVVDEGQDLCRQSHLDVLDGLLHGGLGNGTWRWFEDPHQDVFQRAEQEARATLAAANPTRFPLTVNCRNTLQVARVANELSGLPPGASRGVEGPEPELVTYSGKKEASKAIAKVIRNRLGSGTRPSDVKVLCTPAARSLLPGSAGDVKLAWTTASAVDEVPDEVIECCNVGSFKGLESPLVVLVSSCRDEEAPENRANLYVGASRAVTDLVVIRPDGVEPRGT